MDIHYINTPSEYPHLYNYQQMDTNRRDIPCGYPQIYYALMIPNQWIQSHIYTITNQWTPIKGVPTGAI